MSATLNFKITVVGNAAVFNADNTGVDLDLTHIQFGTGNRIPDGSEEALVAPEQTATISSGSKVSNSQIRVAALFTGENSYPITEIGIWAGEPGTEGAVLFAYWSQADGHIAVMSAGVDFVFSHDMVVEPAIGEFINVVIDPEASTAAALIAAHEAANNPHPQYAKVISVAGKLDKNVAGNGTVALTALETEPAILHFTGALTGNKTVTVPNAVGRWTIVNNTTGTYSLTIKTAAGAGIAVPQNRNADVWCDGVNVALANTIFPQTFKITEIPGVDIGPIIISGTGGEIWEWESSAYYTGYRHIACGMVMPWHSNTTPPHLIPGIGNIYSKTIYARLWGKAQEDGKVVTQAVWDANVMADYYVDLGGDNFRTPDVRNAFIRLSAGATDPDTANVRTLGSRQLDALQNITGTLSGIAHAYSAGGSGAFDVGTNLGPTNVSTTGSSSASTHTFDASRVARTSVETRAKNVAMYPRIHI